MLRRNSASILIVPAKDCENVRMLIGVGQDDHDVAMIKVGVREDDWRVKRESGNASLVRSLSFRCGCAHAEFVKCLSIRKCVS